MTPDRHAMIPPATGSLEPPPEATRLQLDESAPRHGDVDGGWWPRSRSLATELPGLVTALTPRLGRIALVAYHVDDWDTAPDTVAVDGHPIRTDSVGATPQGQQAVAVVAADGQCVTLVLVAPDTAEPAARRTLDHSARTHRDPTGHQDEEIGEAAAASAVRALDDVTTRLIRHTGSRTAQQASDIASWVRDTATEFEHAPIQTYIPILVENLVRNRIAVTTP